LTTSKRLDIIVHSLYNNIYRECTINIWIAMASRKEQLAKIASITAIVISSIFLILGILGVSGIFVRHGMSPPSFLE